MSIVEPGVLTPYSTIVPFLTDKPTWAPEAEQERLASYMKYEQIYWGHPEAYKLRILDDAETEAEESIYVPNPRTICDSTAHFLLKGLNITAEASDTGNLAQALDMFMAREKFLSEFHLAKHSGVVRGDWVFHLTADPRKPSGTRISLRSIDPGSYFPIYHPNDPDMIVGVDLVDQWYDEREMRPQIRKQRYLYKEVGGSLRISTQTAIYEIELWWDGTRAKRVKTISEERLLPEGIPVIPVYHFQNMPWQGQPFGSSELRGFERVMAAVNQSATDEDLALSLEGVGVYATDAPPPTDRDGVEQEWTIAPGKVLETPTGSKFNRVNGVGSVKPFQDHLGYLTEALFEASGTFRPARIDVQVAESGIALALKFLPTLAKLEQRDTSGIDGCRQMFFDWMQWHRIYENTALRGTIVAKIGEKLPENRKRALEELNNMLDRNVIDREYYREKMAEFGWVFPENIEKRILDEMEKFQKAKTPETLRMAQELNGNNSNNAGKTNESAGTEAKAE